MSITIAAASGSVLSLESPIVIAAGAMLDLAQARPDWLQGVGAATTRSVALRGSPSARARESAAGVLLSRPFATVSLDRALRSLLPLWAHLSAPVIVSIAPRSAAEAATLAGELAFGANVAAFELAGDYRDDARPATLARAIEAAAAVGLPVGVKLSANSALIADARAARSAGAAFLVLGTGLAAVFDDGAAAWLCGPATFAPLQSALLDLLAALDLPVIACGGVATARGARLLLEAGATAVGIGAALLRDPSLAAGIAAELRDANVP